LLDEPSLGLAPLVVKQIFEIIKKINSENNTTIFLVEQNANLALKVAHRGYVMENGRITLSDAADSLLANEDVKKFNLLNEPVSSTPGVGACPSTLTDVKCYENNRSTPPIGFLFEGCSRFFYDGDNLYPFTDHGLYVHQNR
jgi:energy-coupling factor transporter ATP-binding protein EcfA2